MGITGLWLAGNEGTEKKMAATTGFRVGLKERKRTWKLL